MGLPTSLVALALLGGEPTPPVAVPQGPEITCEVEVLTVEGLGWRTDAHASLRPASRQGTATIWTADRSLVATLEAAAKVRPSGQATAIKAPKVITAPGAVATVTSDRMQDYIQHARRVADGPINRATAVSYIPEVASVREGFSAVFSGRKLDQGVLAQVKFAESHVGSLHTFALKELVKPAPADAPAAPTTPVALAAEIARRLAGPGPGIAATTVQIPEVFLSEIEGEWFVPNDSVLLISTGVNTVADAEGKAVVQERLAILDFARPAAEADAAVAQAGMFPACRVDATTAAALENYANLSMPRVPDRSFPEAIDVDGKVVDLPPLPEGYAANDLNQISPGSPLATPQGTPITRPSRAAGDPQMVRASFEPIPDSEIQGWEPTPIAFATEPARPAGLAAMVESFLRTGMDAAACPPAPVGLEPAAACNPGLFDPTPGSIPSLPIPAEFVPTPWGHGETTGVRGAVHRLDGRFTPVDAAAGTAADCPAAGCPYAAEGCEPARPAVTASKVEMGVSVRDGKGSCVYNAEQDIVAALKSPGKAEVKFVPLGGGLSLQIEARVVPTPAVAAQPGTSPIQR